MNCPGCSRLLRKATRAFCPACVRLLFDGRPVASTLPFVAQDLPSILREELVKTIRRISISGVQYKASLLLTAANELVISPERGPYEYLLKPPPRSFDLKHVEQVPANEHFTMQLARQVFGLPVAACGLLHFADGLPAAYLTRRFDVLPTGERLLQEDFAQLTERSRATHGDNFKYAGSHEEIAALIRRYVRAAPPALDIFFRLTLFNYLVSNGDAHLKNFSLYRLPGGDYTLTPAYDLLNTSLHVDDGNGLALDLFADDHETPSFAANGYLAYDDFLELGRRIGLPPSRVRRVLADVAGHEAATATLLGRSFLSAEMQARYAASLAGRRQRLRYSLAGS
ncbi:MAG: type II toxin-antitoxin system HipA family toxin [Hymenobacter sp.]|nr:MAG: type II toxin-antitoxin system HipA family toxin [Hymenobacter sp.]